MAEKALTEVKKASQDRRLQSFNTGKRGKSALICGAKRYTFYNLGGWNICLAVKRSLKTKVIKALRKDLDTINSFLPRKSSLFLK